MRRERGGLQVNPSVHSGRRSGRRVGPFPSLRNCVENEGEDSMSPVGMQTPRRRRRDGRRMQRERREVILIRLARCRRRDRRSPGAARMVLAGSAVAVPRVAAVAEGAMPDSEAMGCIGEIAAAASMSGRRAQERPAIAAKSARRAMPAASERSAARGRFRRIRTASGQPRQSPTPAATASAAITPPAGAGGERGVIGPLGRRMGPEARTCTSAPHNASCTFPARSPRDVPATQLGP